MRACRVGTVLVFKCGARAVVRVERSAQPPVRSARSPRSAVSADGRRRISAYSVAQRFTCRAASGCSVCDALALSPRVVASGAE